MNIECVHINKGRLECILKLKSVYGNLKMLGKTREM
jgi:hypothetical protein